MLSIIKCSFHNSAYICNIFVVCGVVGGVRYDGVGKVGFPIYVCGGSLYGNVKLVQGMVFFFFRCKL